METNKKNNNQNEIKDNCNVNSTFNFLVGGIAIGVALLIGYLVYHFFIEK